MVVLALWRVNPISPQPELSRNSGNGGFRFPLGCSCLLAGLDSYLRSPYHSVRLFLTGNVPHRLDPLTHYSLSRYSPGTSSCGTSCVRTSLSSVSSASSTPFTTSASNAFSFLEQLVHTLGIRTLGIGQSLQISRLLARPRSQSLQCECHRIHALAFPPNLFLKDPRFSARWLFAADLRFHPRFFRSCLLLRQLLLGSYPLLCQLLLNRLLHRGHFLASSSLRLCLLLLGFLFGSHARNLSPVGHS